MGGLLGDSTLGMHGNGYRIKITHSAQQKTYVEWKYKKLIRFCRTTQPPKEYVEKKKYKTVSFQTTSDARLKDIHRLFYSDKKKVITKELISAMPRDPMLLAVWYMYDGSTRTDANSGRIASQGFTYEENELLCGYIHEFGIKAHLNVHNEKKGQYTIVLPAETFSDFANLIKPIVSEIPEMMYKLGSRNIP